MSIIGYEGGISAGKTTMMKILSKRTDVNVMYKDVFKNKELTEKYYKDKATFAFPFQMNSQVRKSRLMRDAINNPNKINVIERIPESNFKVFGKMQYEHGFISEDLWNTYCLFYDDLSQFFVDPDVIVYLKTTPKFCFDRKNERKSPGEELITYEYLIELHERYEEWIKTKNNVYTVEVDKDFSEEEINNILNEAIKRIEPKKLERISEKECFLEITKIIRKRSTCKRRNYASLIVKYAEENKRGFILSSGYNGQSSGYPNCSDMLENCKRITNNVPHNENYVQCDCTSIHSEMNACLQIGRGQIDKNCVLYLSGYDVIEGKEVDNPTPCKLCEGVMRNVGIIKYINNTGLHYFDKNIIFSGGNE